MKMKEKTAKEEEEFIKMKKEKHSARKQRAIKKKAATRLNKHELPEQHQGASSISDAPVSTEETTTAAASAAP
jgi:hypothetical protein